MRRIRQVLQLPFNARISARLIAREVGVGRSTVQDYVARATGAKLAWPLPPDLSDTALEQLLFPKQAAAKPGGRRHPEPDWATLVREMKRPGVSLMILWEEYQAVHPQGYGYSRFCDLYRAFERRLSPTMRQTHAAGHKAFVDYSGKKVSIVDPLTGEIRMEAKHGAKSCRKWRNLHLAVDAATGMIVAQKLTDPDADDPSQVAPLLDQIDGRIAG